MRNILVIIFTLAAPLARASETVIVEASPVAELFTSQSCSSCPPAEAHFRRLAARDDVVSLQWHVDYWNDLRVGAAGRWRDPYSTRANTERQRAYNKALRGSGNVYTPQAVVAGRFETVGSRGDEVNAFLVEADAAQRAPVQVAFAPSAAGYDVSLTSPGTSIGAVEIVEIIQDATTAVRGGENNGRTLQAANIAINAQRYEVPDGAIRIGAPPSGASCVVIVRDKSDAILGGAYCPGR
ncbi:MAG: DUF1223 domain-containing protein [Pseudomonadota bacterium]